MSKYIPCGDNYLLSRPPKVEELWRNELQLLYNSMKVSVADPLVIDGQWFDVHEEYDSLHSKFEIPKGKVIVGVRGIIFASSIPKFLGCHEKFLSLVERLNPQTEINQEERKKVAIALPEVYKSLIEVIKEARESSISDDEVLTRLPDEFAIRELLIHYINTELRDVCFKYPHLGKRFPSRESVKAWGSYYILKERLNSLSEEHFQFILDDEQYSEGLYPGSLSSYKSRIRFVKETFQEVDLTKERTGVMLNLLLKRDLI